jgi:hypothetical protein
MHKNRGKGKLRGISLFHKTIPHFFCLVGYTRGINSNLLFYSMDDDDSTMGSTQVSLGLGIGSSGSMGRGRQI